MSGRAILEVRCHASRGGGRLCRQLLATVAVGTDGVPDLALSSTLSKGITAIAGTSITIVCPRHGPATLDAAELRAKGGIDSRGKPRVIAVHGCG